MDRWQELLENWETHTARERRRAQGSIWTPDDLAGWMAAWIDAVAPARVLDPGAGAGALLAPFAGRAELAGCDPDPELRALLAARFPGIALYSDFFAVPASERFGGISANPPYINHAQITGKDELHARLTELTGIRLPRSSNLALLFYLYCWHLLEQGGRMIFLMPTEFMQTRSGVAFKRFLVEERAVCQIVDLADEALFGEQVVSTACLVLAQKGLDSGGITFSRHSGRAPFPSWDKQAQGGRFLRWDELEIEARWRPDHRRSKAPREGRSTLGELCEVRPGVITGNNEFFLRSWEELAELGLTGSACYCLIRPHQLPTPWFHSAAQIEALKERPSRRWLLQIGANPSAAEQRLLDQGVAEGADARPTQQARSPWWDQPVERPCDFTIANFRRERASGESEYNLLAYSAGDELCSEIEFAVVPNLIRLREPFRELRAALFAWLISKSGQAALRENERHAGRGLYTIRSGALKQIPVPDAVLLEARRAELEQALGELKRAVLEGGDLAQAKAALDLLCAGV